MGGVGGWSVDIGVSKQFEGCEAELMVRGHWRVKAV